MFPDAPWVQKLLPPQTTAEQKLYRKREAEGRRDGTAPQPLTQVAGGEAGFAGGFFETVELGLELGPFGGELAELFFGGGGVGEAVAREAGGRRGSALLEAA